MSLDWIISIIENNWQMFLRGAYYTLLISIISTVIGAFIGFFIGIMHTIPVRKKGIKYYVLKCFNFILTCYVEFFRGTPMIVQAVIFYYSFYQLGIRWSPFAAGLFTVSLNTAAYLTEVLRGGIESIDKGQIGSCTWK